MGNQSYDEVAPHYDAAMRPLDRWFLRRWRADMFAQLPEKGIVLEVGAGTGLNFDFYRTGWAGVAAEPSNEMLKIAQSKSRPAGIMLVQTVAERLPFANDSFDAAFASLVFCSVEAPRTAFDELRRVVRTGGTVVLLDHVRPRFLGLLFDLINLVTVPLCGDHVNRRTAETAEAAGLEVIKIQKHALGIFNVITCRV